jgi:hypothetical protein
VLPIEALRYAVVPFKEACQMSKFRISSESELTKEREPRQMNNNNNNNKMMMMMMIRETSEVFAAVEN